jgi:hypothetical protein
MSIFVKIVEYSIKKHIVIPKKALNRIHTSNQKHEYLVFLKPVHIVLEHLMCKIKYNRHCSLNSILLGLSEDS